MELVLLEDIRENLPQGFSPYQIYGIYVDNKEVGRLTLREGSDEERYFDGHIGYTIDEEYRGHGYSYEACCLLKKMVDKDHLLITCDPQNIASRKIIEKLNCEYIETKSVPKTLRKFFAKDEKEKMIFCWKIKEEKT